MTKSKDLSLWLMKSFVSQHDVFFFSYSWRHTMLKVEINGSHFAAAKLNQQQKCLVNVGRRKLTENM